MSLFKEATKHSTTLVVLTNNYNRFDANMFYFIRWSPEQPARLPRISEQPARLPRISEQPARLPRISEQPAPFQNNRPVLSSRKGNPPVSLLIDRYNRQL